ncbi:MAG TPA: prolyl oligopeptidase family serine peptidase [Gemmatimonadaceae bacterium]|nr:prolyl oligopeptidase family serine peptidase [Gemmatimonadaceae bacterium]
MIRLRSARALIFATAFLTPIAALHAQGPAVQQSSRAAASMYFTADDALEINTYAIADMSDDGRWVALTQAVRRDSYGTDFRHDGDPTYVHPSPVRLWSVDARTGERRAVFADKRAVRGMRWSPDGNQLAMLVWSGDVYEPAIWDRTSAKLTTLKLPTGKYVAESSDLRWNAAGSQIVFTVHTMEWRKKARDTFTQMTAGPVFVQSSKDPFLSWDDLRRMGNRRSVAAIEVKSGQYHELVPETQLASYALTNDGKVIAYAEDQTKKTEYEAGGNDARLLARSLSGGDSRTLLASTRGAAVVWAEDGTRYAYSRDGRVYVGSLADTATRLIAGPPEPPKGTVPAPSDSASRTGRGSARPDRFTAIRFSPRADALLASNRDGLWVIDLGTQAREMVIASNDSNSTTPRATIAAWSEDGSKLYFTVSSRTKWERAIVAYDRTSKQTRELVKDGRSYSGLRLSKDGNTSFLTVAEGNRPADVYVGGADLSKLHRFVESNPQLATKHIGPTELLPYLDADGHPKYAVVHYPADYQKGKTYPTVFIIYEDFFDDSWDVAANILSANGYLVVKPSVDFETGFPGEAWLKGVTAAANKLIELGVADSARLGVQGTSYGGYATNLLITQTNRFKAAINISGKVDIISFYTDSPRLGVRNITAAERQQDRLGATLWQQPQKYVQHSAIMFADRIQTPLMLITGAQDSNVPADNTREMYYGLRRLGKEVVWVNYLNGGHGGGVQSTDDFLDMYRRMVEWYDTKLKQKSTAKTATHDR